MHPGFHDVIREGILKDSTVSGAVKIMGCVSAAVTSGEVLALAMRKFARATVRKTVAPTIAVIGAGCAVP